MVSRSRLPDCTTGISFVSASIATNTQALPSSSASSTLTLRSFFPMKLQSKRLGNTPFRREACVVKWLDE